MPSLDTIDGPEVASSASAERSNEGGPEGAIQVLRPRAVGKKPSRIDSIASGFRSDMLVLKFRVGARVRRRGGKFEVETSGDSAADEARLARDHVTLDAVERDVERANVILAAAPKAGRASRTLL